MICRPGQTFCITHSPLFLKCCEQGNSKQSISQAVLSPMASASSGGRVIPKPLQLKWHVPNGDPSVYGRVMIPFSWILSGSSVEFVVPSWFLNRKGLSPPALFAFIFPLFFWAHVGLRGWQQRWHLLHGRTWSWGTHSAAPGRFSVHPDTTRVPKKWIQQSYRCLGFGATLNISTPTRVFWKVPQERGWMGLAVLSTGKLCSVSLAKLAQCHSPRGLLPLLQQNCSFPLWTSLVFCGYLE